MSDDAVMDDATQTIDAEVFVKLQASIDSDAAFRDDIRAILKELDRVGRSILSILSRAHSTSISDRELYVAP